MVTACCRRRVCGRCSASRSSGAASCATRSARIDGAARTVAASASKRLPHAVSSRAHPNCLPHACRYFAVCPNGLPAYTCAVQCAPTVLYFWNECAELYQNHTEWTALSNDGLSTIPLLTALETSAALCEETVYREGAKAIYEELHVHYFPFAGWIILMLPFFFCLIFVFFGRHLSSLFRTAVGAGACSMQILWPALAPYIARCGIGIARYAPRLHSCLLSLRP